MIESLIIKFLETALNINVYVMFPDEPQTPFIVLDRTATDITNHVTSYEIAVQSYGSSALAAAELNEKVIEAMQGFVAVDEIARCKLNNSYMFTDTERKMNRYQATFAITML